MVDLLDRYIHQVGRYLPPGERAEIEAELRSQIQDQIDDRVAGVPTPADVAAVLAELGEPRRMAAAYNRDHYLVGPDLYPYLMTILRRGWLIVPSIVVFLSLFGALSAGRVLDAQLVGDLLIDAAEGLLLFSGAVVLVFALIERLKLRLDAEAAPFDPQTLPPVDDPRAVDRFETVFGIAFGGLFTLVLVYFAQAGGLTMRFNLADPGEVIPTPMPWLLLLIGIGVASIVLHLFILRRGRWSAGVWFAQTLLEIPGILALYFALFEPVAAHVVRTYPHLDFVSGLPEIVAVLYAVGTLTSRGTKQMRLMSGDRGASLAYTATTQG